MARTTGGVNPVSQRDTLRHLTPLMAGGVVGGGGGGVVVVVEVGRN